MRAVDALAKLLREGLSTGVTDEGQPMAAALAARASAGRAWLQNAHAVLEILQVWRRSHAPALQCIGRRPPCQSGPGPSQRAAAALMLA